MSSHMKVNEEQLNELRLAHSILASLAWVIFFPAGAISIRLWHNRLSIWVHAITQVFAYVLFIASVGIGIKLALELDTLGAAILTSSHSIIGLVIFGLVFFQPILGLAHHLFWRKHSRRTLWSHAHLWLGRILITLAIINGGLGFWITGSYQQGLVKGEIVYGAIAGTVWIVYVAAAVFGEIRRATPYDGSMDKTASSSDSESEKGHVSVEAEKSDHRVWKGGQLVSH